MDHRKIKHVPHRLDKVFYDHPLYFVTFNTWHRAKILDNKPIFDAFMEYGKKNVFEGRAIGRFVIMPDHIHLFVRIGHDSKLSNFVRLLKQRLTKELRSEGYKGDIWQPGFFDHLLRSSESYAEKWLYVFENPVRKKLVHLAEDWPWQGEVVVIDRV